MINWIKNNKAIVFIFLIALIVRVVLFAIALNHSGGNLITTIYGADGYYELSQGILAGHGFTGYATAPFLPNPLRPPVWPLLIALVAKVFGSYWAVAVFEIILGSFIPVLGIYVARRFLSKRHANIVGVLMAIEPYSILLSFILYSETSFTFLFLIFLIFLFRYVDDHSYRNAVWGGLFLALACLVKPTVEYFPFIIPIVLFYVLRKELNYKMGRHLLAFLAVFILCISPWLYWNHLEFKHWGMSAQPAYNLYVYMVPTVLAIENHSDFATELNKNVLVNGFDDGMINLSNSTFYTNKALAILMQHKKALVTSFLLSEVTFFTHDGMLTILQNYGITFKNIISEPVTFLIIHPKELISIIAHYSLSPAIFILILRIIWCLVTLFMIIGAVIYLMKNRPNKAGWLAVIIVSYFSVTTAINGLGVNARFRVPVLVFIFILAVYGFYAIKERISKRKKLEHEIIDHNPVL